jgi:hypothetical protein
VQATVTQKNITRGRRSVTYTLTVRSWRPGKSNEDLEVNAATYQNAGVGQKITVQIHKGFFGLPWYSGVSTMRG